MKFEIKKPDYERSPYTGMTREHWIEAALFFLEGIFSHVKSSEDGIVVPRHDTTAGYPRENGPEWRLYAERFEGLARSFLLAAPVLHNRPEASACGYSLRDYYKKHILEATRKGSPNYLLRREEILKTAEEGEQAFQHTCECASLVIGLFLCKEVLWDTYTREEKDCIADYLSDFGHGKTSHHNWRLFNMLILGFLYREGYPVKEELIRDHASVIVSYYAGDGWYRDGHFFDYYCPWAFHVYGPLWNLWYGYEKEPYLAEKIEQYSNLFVKTYPSFFDRDARVTMWGRSSIYRNAAAAPLAANFLLEHAQADPGLARRIASGSLMQFAGKPECFYQGVMSLGFYGPFKPLIQSYSCGASPLWLANPFVCLYLPEDHAFWTEREKNGVWEKRESQLQDVLQLTLPGPGITVDNEMETGAALFRTAKVLMEKEHPYLNVYSRLSFHSAYPWEDFDYEGVEAMQYSLLYEGESRASIPNLILYRGERDGVLYRKAYFDFSSSFQDKASIDLAEVKIPYGFLRADKIRIPNQPYTLTMGAYGMPEMPEEGETTVTYEMEPEGGAGGRAVILTSGYGRIALVSYKGMQKLDVKIRKDRNPAAKVSLLAYAETKRMKEYAYEEYVLITAVLTGLAGSSFTKEELFPVKSICFADSGGMGGYGPVILDLKNGNRHIVDYEGAEGALSL